MHWNNFATYLISAKFTKLLSWYISASESSGQEWTSRINLTINSHPCFDAKSTFLTHVIDPTWPYFSRTFLMVGIWTFLSLRPVTCGFNNSQLIFVHIALKLLQHSDDWQTFKLVNPNCNLSFCSNISRWVKYWVMELLYIENI